LKKYVELKEKECIHNTFYSIYSKKYLKDIIHRKIENNTAYYSICFKSSEVEEKSILSSVKLVRNIFKEFTERVEEGL